MIRKSGSPLPVGIGRQPVDERLRGRLAGQVAVALAVAQVGVADVVAVGALRLEVVDDDREAGAGRVDLEGLGQRRAVLGVDEARVDRSSRGSGSADRGDDGRAVDHADLDRVGADRAGVDVGVARQPGHDALERLDAGRVLQLVEADDVGVEAGERGEQLVALARELGRLVGVPAAALDVVRRAALVVERVAGRVVGRDEEVERVHRGDADRAADGLRCSRARVGRGVVGGPGREDAVQAEVVAQDADRVLDGVAAAEQVG